MTYRLFVFMKGTPSRTVFAEPDSNHTSAWTDEIHCEDLEAGYRHLRSLKKGSYLSFVFKKTSLQKEQTR